MRIPYVDLKQQYIKERKNTIVKLTDDDYEEIALKLKQTKFDF